MAETFANLLREVGVSHAALDYANQAPPPPRRMPRQMRPAQERLRDANPGVQQQARRELGPVARDRVSADLDMHAAMGPPREMTDPEEAAQLAWQMTPLPHARAAAFHIGRSATGRANEWGQGALELGETALAAQPLWEGAGALRPRLPASRVPMREPATPLPQNATRDLGYASDGSVLPVAPAQPFRNSLRGGSADLTEAALPRLRVQAPDAGGAGGERAAMPDLQNASPEQIAEWLRHGGSQSLAPGAGRFRFEDVSNDQWMRMKDAPVVGEETVPLNELTSIQRYLRRDFDPAAAAAAYDQNATGVPEVFRAEDGRLYILDGHNRLTGAAMRGDETGRVIVRGSGAGRELTAPRAPALEGRAMLPSPLDDFLRDFGYDGRRIDYDLRRNLEYNLRIHGNGEKAKQWLENYLMRNDAPLLPMLSNEASGRNFTPQIEGPRNVTPPASPAEGASAGGRVDLDHVRYWVERYGGGPEGEAKAVRELRQELQNAERGEGPSWERRRQDLRAQIAAVEDGSYRQGRPNVSFSQRVEDAFPDLYRRTPNTPNGGDPPLPPSRLKRRPPPKTTDRH